MTGSLPTVTDLGKRATIVERIHRLSERQKRCESLNPIKYSQKIQEGGNLTTDEMYSAIVALSKNSLFLNLDLYLTMGNIVH